MENQKRKNKVVLLEIFFILALFAVSVFIRMPQLGRHFENGHEWLTAHTLIQQRIWYDDGALNHRFRFVLNYPRQADKFINNACMSDFESGNFYDEAGNYYYPSYPSFGIAFPYLFFRALDVYPNVGGIQAFNLILHGISAVLIYFIFAKIHKSKWRFNFAAVLAAALYIMLPMNLWFLSNTYFVEMFVQFAFILLVFLSLVLQKNYEVYSRFKRGLYLFFLWAAAFAASASEWLGLLASLLIALYFLIHIKRAALNRFAVLSLGLGAAASMGVYIWQYSGAIGFGNFMQYLSDKFIFRVGANEGGLAQVDFSIIGKHYLYGFFALAAIFLFALLIAVFNIKKVKKIHYFSKYAFVLYAFFIPAFIHQALFLNFTSVHHYSPLKISMFLILACCLLIGELINLGIFDDKFKFFFLCVLILFAFYTSYQTYKNYYVDTIDRSDQKEYYFGEYIANTAKDDEVVFFRFGRPTSPHIVYYSGRNYVAIPDIEEAKKWLEQSPVRANRGIIFNSWEDYTYERFEVEK